MAEPVILETVRIPIGKRNGALREVRPDTLYAHILDALLVRSGIQPEKIEDVVTGCVTQAGEQGANLGRLAVLISNLPQSVPALTLDRMCGSSQQAIHFAAQAIAAGDMHYAIAGGVESMTRAPMFSDIGGGFERLNPALHAKYEIIHQGESAERIIERYGLSRQDLDMYALESHQRAVRAWGEGFQRKELAPIQGLTREGKVFLLDHDEGVRPEANFEAMMALPPAFRTNGKVSAGNSSQISDGAAAVLIADRDVAIADGFKPRARFRARVVVAGDPTLQLWEVVPATQEALRRASLSLDDLAAIEINEAFAGVVLAWAHVLEPKMERVNPNGGAIAHGHPLGATGAVLLTKLLHHLETINGQFGLQVMCIGHGMATATVIERV